MNAPISPITLLDAVRRERDKRNAERSLIEFTRQCWSINEPGTFVTWARPFVEQDEKFHNSELKDNVDAFTQFVIWARDSDYFDLDFVEGEPPEEVDYHGVLSRALNKGQELRKLKNLDPELLAELLSELKQVEV